MFEKRYIGTERDANDRLSPKLRVMGEARRAITKTLNMTGLSEAEKKVVIIHAERTAMLAGAELEELERKRRQLKEEQNMEKLREVLNVIT